MAEPAKFVFVLEQTLGHVAHGRNIERALAGQEWIEPTVIHIPYTPARGLARLPLTGSWSMRASRATRLALSSRLREGPADALFIHTQVASLLVRDVMRRVPTVLSLDATPRNFDQVGRAYGHQRDQDFLETLKHRVNGRAYAAAGALVTWCHWAATSLRADYGVPKEKVRVIRPGVDLHRFRPSDRIGPDGLPRLLFVGGDFARKGGPDLVLAMRQLLGLAELDIVTTHPVALPDLPHCRVHSGLGPQSDALVDLYRRADIFVLPSRGDCFPQAIAEAMACGLPVVASDIGAVSEMVRHGVNGYLVPPGSPRDLARAVSALLNHPILRAAMGQASRELAEREHDADRNNHSIFDLMAQLVADQARSRSLARGA